MTSKTNTLEKKKACYFCVNGLNEVDYKDIDLLRRFISPYTAKIFPRKKTNVCTKHQRHLAAAIKRARFVALLPFVKK